MLEFMVRFSLRGFCALCSVVDGWSVRDKCLDIMF